MGDLIKRLEAALGYFDGTIKAQWDAENAIREVIALLKTSDTESIQAKVDTMLVGMWNGENYDVTPGEIVALIEQEVVAAKTAPAVALTRLAIRVGGSGANVYAFTEADDDGDYVFYTEAVAASKHGDPK